MVLGSSFWVLKRGGSRTRLSSLFFLLASLALSSCGSPGAAPAAQQRPPAEWRTLGNYTGHGNEQTPSFTSDTGGLRIIWEGKTAGSDPPPEFFRLTVHSAISGRPLIVAVDHKGAGKGTALVGEDPRVFYAEIESNGLDWSITVQERIN